ncbi:toll-like receptor [Plakobranchus ocellatus]|uniref:Toll-like receptor n=1 Tax=Plakobranchus ocellatus TaxID=259542 RepID=A0AAV4A237_9GAST|nr:toll-like receptor [Plakobranchus ocellatus]
MRLTVIFVCLAISPVWSGIDVPCSSNCTCRYDDNQFLAVNCSSRGFYSIPQDVPETAVSLDLSSNFISTWRTASIAKLTHLLFINLSNNVIKKIISVSKEGGFIASETLKFISDQPTDMHLLPPVSHSLGLKILRLNDNQIVSLDNGVFAEFSSLEELDLSQNRLKILLPGVFRGLYSLESLYLQQNNLDLCTATYPTTVFADLKRLKRLNIQDNHRFGTSLLSRTPALTKLVHLNNTDVKPIDNRTYPDKALSSLVSLSVLQMDALQYDILPGPGFRYLTNLTVLDFSKSKALTGLPELFFSNFSFQKPLQLILSQSALTFVHPGSFAYLPTLHSLSLRDNTGLDFSGFEKASRSFLKTNIKRLDISRIHASVNPAITLDLSDNPLVCDCSALSFLHWVVSTKVLLKNVEAYHCRYVNGSTLLVSDVVGKLMPSLYSRCFGQDIFTVVSVAFFVLTMALTAAAIYSYFHSRLLFLIYISKKRYFQSFFDIEQSGIRDVFLVFDDESRVWRSFVARVMKPALERRGVSCYISEIDSLAGRPIRLVVEESVLAGRKTLVLLTRDLLKCEEKVLEINMALLAEEMRVTEVLVFLRLEEMTEFDLPNHIHRILQRRPVIHYPGNYRSYAGDAATRALRSGSRRGKHRKRTALPRTYGEKGCIA